MDEMVVLKDGRQVAVTPLQPADLNRLLLFFRDMPEEDRVFLRMDVTDRDLVARRIEETVDGKAYRLVATDDGRIVAYGVMELEGHGWEEHIGELRLIVARDYQRIGLGMRLARRLYLLAAKKRVEVIMARMLGPQTAARRILERLGFREEVVLKDHARDRRGRLQDMIVMRCELQTLLQEMELYFKGFDWERVR